jgi:sugar phosphate isomerase/epimerase
MRELPLSGVGDEAGPELADQIAAHQQLGWRAIELRTIGGVALAELPQADFARARTQLADAGLAVHAIASRIGNWSRPISTPLALDLDELDVLAERAHQLGARYLRVMSYPNDGLREVEWRARVHARLGQLVERARRHDLVLVHENCAGWGGVSAQHARALVEAIDSPHFRLLFDVGNPVVHDQNSLAWLREVLPWVVHVHIKDARRGADGETGFTWVGDGDAQVLGCIRLLHQAGYAGGLSIEPHLHLVPHLGKTGDRAALLPSFVEYGRRLEALLLKEMAS